MAYLAAGCRGLIVDVQGRQVQVRPAAFKVEKGRILGAELSHLHETDLLRFQTAFSFAGTITAQWYVSAIFAIWGFTY